MTACPFCAEPRSWPLPFNADPGHEICAAQPARATAYGWRLCRRCGNGYPTFQPRLRQLADLWNRNQHEAITDSAQAETVWRQRQALSQIGAERSYRIFAKHHGGPPGRFLDIACGLGEAVALFARRGWQAQGIDADPSVQPFHRRLGIGSEIGQIETAVIEGRFDIIQIAHAIYFITEPLRFLKSLHERLSPNGLLCIVLADFMAAEDLSLPSRVHSFFPTARSMRYLLALAGFKISLARSLSGSIYIAARPGRASPPPIHSWLIRAGYQSKRLRYLLFGQPKLYLHRIGKRLVGRRR